MSTAITSSTSTSTELAALPGTSEKRGAASAAQAASAKAVPVMPSSSLRMRRLLIGECGRRGARRLAPKNAVHLCAHEAGQTQPDADERFPILTPHRPAAAPGTAGAGELVIEGKAVGAVIHANFFARRDAAQRNDRIHAVVAEIRLAAVIDEVHRVTHRLWMERAGDLIERGVEAIADERTA